MFARVGVLIGVGVVLASAGVAQAQRARPVAPPSPVVAIEPSAWIGIGIKQDPGIAGGVPVTMVWEPALSAGVLEGDEVLSVGGVRVATASDLISVVRRYSSGAKVTLELGRAGKTLTVPVTLEPKPTNSELVQRALLDKPAPALEGERSDRGTSTGKLLDHRGEVVLVAVFHASCTSCEPVFTQLAALAKDATRRISIVGAFPGSGSSARTFASYRGLSFDVLAIDDETRTRWGLFDVSAPVVVVVDPRGVVRYAGAIDSGQSPEDALRAVAIEIDQAIFAAGRLQRAQRGVRR